MDLTEERDLRRRLRRAEQRLGRIERQNQNLRRSRTQLEAGIAHYRKRLVAQLYVTCSGCHDCKYHPDHRLVLLAARNTGRLLEAVRFSSVYREAAKAAALALHDLERIRLHEEWTKLLENGKNCPYCQGYRSYAVQENDRLSCSSCGYIDE